MRVYRICKRKYRNDLSGNGAALAGGRWNSKGVELVYTSESIALAMLEVLVHIPKRIIPDDYVIVPILLPDRAGIETVKPGSLPKGWKKSPYIEATALMGDDFVKRRDNLILKVPSSIAPGSHNLLLNPLHKDMKKVKVEGAEKFSFDRRLFT